jgi:hypothetical protein
MTEGRRASQRITRSVEGKGHSRALPASLKVPINITFDQVIAQARINNGTQECDLSDHLRDELQKLRGDIQHLIVDVAMNIGFDLKLLQLHLQSYERPLLDLFACKFPLAFRFQLAGTPKKAKKWNSERKLELVNFVDQLKYAGHTEAEACDWYAFLTGNRDRKTAYHVPSFITRYHEAKVWLSEKDSWTSYERMEVLGYCYRRGMFE